MLLLKILSADLMAQNSKQAAFYMLPYMEVLRTRQEAIGDTLFHIPRFTCWNL